ncbi:hypothetical protein [Enterococcus mundtii]|uniref:DUF5626 domain-containing protein n=1 Tax=Enterococcus mundtii TaxID=53346 RepID=A0A2T5DAS7_ENTMU|nr:hypothetical protein [Enterococcus mundtii]PTO34745.1 hypothetical protein C6N14_10670 [Enterococcus mundtii]
MKKVLTIVLISLFGFVGFELSSMVVNGEEIDFQTQEQVIPFHELTLDEQEYFKSKGFDSSDTFYTTETVSDQDSKLRLSANVLRLTASTKKISNTQGRTEYIITSPNSPMYRISTRLNLGNVQSYTQTVNLYNVTGYSGGMYFTYTGKRNYYSVRLAMQVYNTFGVGSVSSTAGGLTIGK